MKRLYPILFLILMTASAFVLISPLMTHDSALREDGLAEADLLTPDFDSPTIWEPPYINTTLADEGTLSDDSILEFHETLPDDVLFYPDSIAYDEIFSATAGSAYPGTDYGDYTDTYADDNNLYATTLGETTYIILNFSVPSGKPFNRLNIEAQVICTAVLSVGAVQALDHNDNWVNITTLPTGAHTYDIDREFSDSAFWDGFSGATLSIRTIKQYFGASTYVSIDFMNITYSVMTLADSEHYAESFADVSDWDVTAGDISISTDGDVMSHEADSWQHSYTNDISLASMDGYYIEYRLKANVTHSTGQGRAYGYHSDDRGGGVAFYDNVAWLTSWQTFRTYIPNSLGYDAGVLECATFTSGQDNAKLEIDNLRISKGDEMGFSHDGSTTAGVVGGNGGTLSSDGDSITCIDDGDGSVYDFYVDTTTTKACLNPNTYQFIELKFTSGDSYFQLDSMDENDNLATVTSYTDQGSTTLYRYNLDAAESSYMKFLRLTSYAGYDLVVDYLKVYSIANYTYGGGTIATTDYMYVDSGALVIVESGGGWQQLNRDPALSVDTAIYNVWNVTRSVTGLRIKPCVGGAWEGGSSGYTDSRGTWSGTGTLTDIIIVGICDVTISAIKFWEDAVAPTIEEKWSTPQDPNTGDDVTISIVTTDLMGVYEATATPLSEPSGSNIGTQTFTLIDENPNNAMLWVVTIDDTDLIEGLYIFEIDVSDGANNDYEYLTFTVSPATQTTYIRIFDSLGDFVPFETFEVYRNGSRQYTDTFEGDTESAYQIQVKDRWGESLNTTTFSAGVQELVVTVEVYSLKVMSWHYDFVRFNVTRAGLTYSEIVTPLEVINFRLYTNTYDWAIDYLNGTSTSGDITLTNSTALIVTGSTISDVLGLVNTVNTMTTAINITTTTISNEVVTIQLMFDWSNTTLYNQSINIIAAFNWENTTLYNQTISIASLFNATNTVLYDQIILIQNMFNWENTTLFNQTISILNAFNATNTVIYEQTISILSEISSMNATIYGQTVSLLNYLYFNSSSIYNQTIDILTQLSLIGSNITANYISLGASLVAIDSSLLANFTSVSATLLAIDSSLLSNFTSVTADLILINSALASNFTAVVATLSAIGSNITANYLSIAATLSMIDSSLLNNFTSVTATLSAIGTNITANYLLVSATLLMIDSALLSNFTELTAELLAVNSTIGSQFLSVSATLSMLDSSLLSNFTSVSATLLMIDSALLSNFTSITATLSAIGSNVTSNYLSVAATLSMIDSSLLSNFTAITSTLTTIGSNITTNYLAVSATLSMLDSSLLSNFTEISATLLMIDSSLLSNFTSITSTLAALGSNVTSNYLSVAAALVLIDSNLFSNFTSITSTLTAMGSNITTNYLTITAELALIDSSLAANFTSITARLIATNSSLFIQTLAIISDLEFLNATMYLIDDPTHLNPLVLGYSLSDDYCDLTIVTNWHNASISVYDNDVLRTGPTSELLCPIRYPLLATAGTHNLSIFVDGGNDSFWYNISYTVAEIIAFEVEEWDVNPHLGVENYLECIFRTTWGNSTIYVYLNDSLQTSVLEQEGGISFSFWMSGISGLHNYVFNVTSGTNVITITWDFYLPDWADTGLVVRWDMWTFQDNYTLITLESNWMNCTYYLYLNDSLVATSYNDPVTLNFTRDMNIGEYNLTIHAYGGNSNYTIKNIRYIVTEEGVSYDFSSVTGGRVTIVGDTYEGDTYGDIYENPTGVFIDQATAALVAVGSFLIIFMAFLVAREIRKRDQEKTERMYSQ